MFLQVESKVVGIFSWIPNLVSQSTSGSGCQDSCLDGKRSMKRTEHSQKLNRLICSRIRAENGGRAWQVAAQGGNRIWEQNRRFVWCPCGLHPLGTILQRVRSNFKVSIVMDYGPVQTIGHCGLLDDALQERSCGRGQDFRNKATAVETVVPYRIVGVDGEQMLL